MSYLAFLDAHRSLEARLEELSDAPSVHHARELWMYFESCLNSMCIVRDEPPDPINKYVNSLFGEVVKEDAELNGSRLRALIKHPDPEACKRMRTFHAAWLALAAPGAAAAERASGIVEGKDALRARRAKRVRA
jgi:hypothetical protein